MNISPKLIFWSITPSVTSEYGLILEIKSLRYNYLRWAHTRAGWIPTPIWQVSPSTKNARSKNKQTNPNPNPNFFGEKNRKNITERWSQRPGRYIRSHKMLKLASKLPEAGEGSGKIFPSQPSEETTIMILDFQHHDFGLSTSRTVRQ